MTYDPLQRRRSLNFSEACKLAKEKWGPAGSAEARHSVPFGERCVVGTKGALPGEHIIGRGSTWEEAFEDANKKGVF